MRGSNELSLDVPYCGWGCTCQYRGCGANFQGFRSRDFELLIKLNTTLAPRVTTQGVHAVAAVWLSSPERDADTKTAIEDLRAEVACLQEELRNAHQLEKSVVSEARTVNRSLDLRNDQFLFQRDITDVVEQVR